MTDNLKTRIAEAIANGLGEKNSIDAIAKAVLDIVQPMLDGLQGVIDSQTQTNQALIRRIPQPIEGKGWFIPINEHWNDLMEDSFRNMMDVIKYGGQVDVVARIDGKDYKWECDGLRYACFIQPLPTPPEKE